MSKEEAAKTGEVVETLKNLWSPMDLDRDLYFHLPLSPRSPGFCLSPLWNFHEDNHQEFTGDIRVTSTTNVLPQSPGETLLFESLAGNHETLKQSPQQCLTDRITQALAYIKKSTDRQVLAQVWVPVKMGTQYVLTTSDQPFLLSLDCNGLAQYRLVSSMYMFSIDAINVDLGLPGRVFRTKLPEWSPNVQYYSIAEYPQLIHAIRCNVRGTLALPLFVSGGSCIGVLELIMTSQKINYAPEIDLLYRALEAVELKSSETFKLPHTHVVDENDQIQLVEILELLTIVSETYKLPLAQTWIPSSNRQVVPCGGSLLANTSFEGRLMKQVCLSTSNLAFYVVDAHMWGFREASTEHSLLEGQGVVGRAYLSLKSCFCKDVNQFCKIEYPLVHYARLFGLHSCFAVPICDTQTCKNIYILEFFLPTTLANFRYLQKLLNFLSATLSQSSPNLHMISHKECSKDGAIELINFHVDMKPALSPEYFQSQKTIMPSKYGCKNFPTSETISCKHVRETNSYEQPGKQETDLVYKKTKIKINESEICLSYTNSGKEDKWSLEVLEQLYGKSLQDAADCLGVSRSTMKRICRKHGVSRWPSSKRKKAGRVSHKQTHKNELHQGAEGTISCISPNLYPNISSVVSTTSCSTTEQSIQHELELQLKQTKLNLLYPHSAHDSLHSARGHPETHPGEIVTKNTSFPMRSLQIQSADKQIFECSRELPSIRVPHLEKIVRNDTIGVPAPKLSMDAATHGEGTASIKVKARYGENIIKFVLHYPSALVDLEKEVQKRLNLKLGTFTLEYLDVDGDWILIACDEDLQQILDVFLSKGIIRMLVGDINGCQAKINKCKICK